VADLDHLPRGFGFGFGNGGWIRLYGLVAGDSAPFALVRMTEAASGWLEIAELYLEGRVSDTVLDRLRPRPLERLLNSQELSGRIKERLGTPGCDLRRAASYYGTSFGGDAFDENGRGMDWAAEMWLSQFPDPSIQRQPGWKMRKPVIGIRRPPLQDSTGPGWLVSVDCRLDVPTERPYGDAFYRSVASIYIAIVAAGERAPAKAIEAANNVTQSQAHRWIKEARRRGILAPAELSGRAG